MMVYIVAYKFETEKEYDDYMQNEDDFKLMTWLVDNNITVIDAEDCTDLVDNKEVIEFSFKFKKDAKKFAKAFNLKVEGPSECDFTNPWLPPDWNGDWDKLPGFRG